MLCSFSLFFVHVLKFCSQLVDSYSMQDQQFTHVARSCFDCDNTARVLVLVPWINASRGEQGATWMPFCRHCTPADDWQTVVIKNTSPEVVDELLTELRNETY